MANSAIHPPSSVGRPHPIFIAGPTAVGKSEVALLLAEKIGGEIISVDSMQVYRGLDIGTAKPSAAELARVPHHLIDVADLSEPFDVSKFAELARNAVSEIQSRNHVPIFCGGTGLYFKAFLDGLSEAPASDPKLRTELESTPLDELLRELAERDPLAHQKIDRKNPRRVIRAIEVIRLTGKPFSDTRADWQQRPVESEVRGFFVCSRGRLELQDRINRRVDEMFRHGLVEEVEGLLERGLLGNRTAMQALGYSQVVEYLRGERSHAETVELVKIKTRQFAKRQMTWFRRLAGAKWIELGTDASAAVEMLSTAKFS
ncbi:MAG TPA: tRNA (adenosine(37)-N6)-dimethylallyltransferase MiaA [Candidatus Paceibacterota bacterium]|nr:tRNA (adenosine(37)-N6)-dimethylallyltransferase MiaA [Candidatus Paceibacterota bacterium]